MIDQAPSDPTPEAAPGAKAPAKRDPVAAKILDLVTAAGMADSIRPVDVAHAIAADRRKPTDRPDAWRRYLQAVNEQARALARKGEILILRKGRIADPAKPIKGVIKLALPGGTWKEPKPGDEDEDGGGED